MDVEMWLEATSGYPALYLTRCYCGNPIVGPLAAPRTCGTHDRNVCAIPGCTAARMARYVLCSRHAKRRYQHGHPHYQRPPVNYRTAHQRMGRAADRACVDCGGAARDWSYTGGDPDELYDETYRLTYSLKREHYVPRCRSCHMRTDGAVERLRRSREEAT